MSTTHFKTPPHFDTTGCSAPAPAPVRVDVAIARGDGIGPEIMDAALHVLHRAGASLNVHEIAVGKAVYLAGNTSGIDPAAWAALRKTRLLLKGPITTPQGGGYKSLNVTIRKTLGLYANVRPVSVYHPFVATKHPSMNVVIVRENEEDLYAGIEHRQTDEVTQCLKLISRPGCEKIVRYAFEYARRAGRRKVTCFTKDNIMKMTDGLFHRVFDEVAAEYGDIAADHMIVDIGAARLADSPERFDVIVMPNLYGDILSDVAAEIAGSVGIAPSANIGDDFAMFEAIHGSAPDIAGKGIANPSGLLLSAVMMLNHVGQGDVASRVHNAWLRTIEDGVHTGDVYSAGSSRQRVGTAEFAEAVCARIGESPRHLPAAAYTACEPIRVQIKPQPPATKELVGVDVFVHSPPSATSAEELGQRWQALDTAALQLQMVTNRGVKVFPGGVPETFCTDHWRCRFVNGSGAPLNHSAVLALLQRFAAAGIDFIKTEHLYTFDGVPGYSLGQGQ